MSFIKKLLMRYLDNLNIAERKVRNIDRRLKFLEEENHTALLEPETLFQEVPGVKIINCNAINSVDEDAPDTVFANNGTFEFDNSKLNKQKVCLLHFEEALKSRAIIFGLIRFTVVTNPTGTLSSVFVSVSASVAGDIITSSDWNPSTVTWNNAPDSPFFGGTNSFGSIFAGSSQFSFRKVAAGDAILTLQVPTTELFFQPVGPPGFDVFGYNIQFPNFTMGDNTDEFAKATATITDPFNVSTSSFIVQGIVR